MRIAIAGGGTGGHLFPGIAVAEEALSRGVAESVVFFGSERGIESRAVPDAGFELIAHAQSLEGREAEDVQFIEDDRRHEALCRQFRF